MTGSTEPPQWRVTHWERNDSGTLLFSVRSPQGLLYTVALSVHGEWRVTWHHTYEPALFDASAARSTAAHYMIDRAFGGKTS